MNDTNPKRGWGNSLAWLLLGLGLIFGLGACSGGSGVKPFPITPAIAAAIPCEPEVGPSPLQVSDAIAALDESKAPGRRAGLEDWGLNPDLKDPAAVKAIDEVRSALRTRVNECQAAKPTPSATPTSSASPSATPSSTPTPSTSASATPSATETPAADPAAEYVIKMPKRDGNRLRAGGFPKKIRKDGEAIRRFVAEQAKHDPLTLYLYYMASPLGKAAPLKNEAVLAKDGKIQNGNVYSPEGIEAYQRWAAIWNNKDITTIKAVKEVQFRAVNTGVSGRKTTQDKSGVRGKDRSGVNVTYRNATGGKAGAHSALNRCTQPTTGKAIPRVAVGKTDNPPPAKVRKPRTPPGTYTPPVTAKKVWKDPARRGNVPTQVKGKAPKARKSHRQPTRPADPPATYTPPAPPKKKSPPKDSTPTEQPSESPAKNANDSKNDTRIDEPDD